MKKLIPTEATVEYFGSHCLIYVYIQPQHFYKEHPLSQEVVEGWVLYDENLEWNGFEFMLENETYTALFREDKPIVSKDETTFILDVNDLGIYGIESIDAYIDQTSYAQSFIKD